MWAFFSWLQIELVHFNFLQLIYERIDVLLELFAILRAGCSWRRWGIGMGMWKVRLYRWTANHLHTVFLRLHRRCIQYMHHIDRIQHSVRFSPHNGHYSMMLALLYVDFEQYLGEHKMKIYNLIFMFTETYEITNAFISWRRIC